MEHQSRKSIWTIGHSSSSIDDFVQLLQSNFINRIVDVRSAPYSRFASQFNRLDIEAFLKRRGIDYRYDGKRLGGRPDDPTCYRSGIVPAHAEREEFLKLVDYEAVKRKDWFLRALDDVIEESESQHIALMCTEGNPLECHRHWLIASALNERDVEVLHLRRDGTVKPATFASEPALIQASMF